jgi:hypothetical protein
MARLKMMDFVSRLLRALAVAVVVAAIAPRSTSAETLAGELAARALKACEDGRRAEGRSEREARFTDGQALAEKAVALDDLSADAHFALFCNLGELLRIDGEGQRPSFSGFRRMMSELDRTLALRADHVDALAVKGILLTRLPRLLGGNAREGETILRRVISLDRDAISSRLALAKICAARGERDEAATLASDALELARSHQRTADCVEAESILADVGGAPAAPNAAERVALR